MRIISFNINGIQSMTGKLKNGEKKGGPTNNVLRSLVEEQQPDVLCMQELKTQTPGHLAWLRAYFPHIHLNLSKHKKGYSGVALLSKEEPEWVATDFSRYTQWLGDVNADWSHEGRVIIAKFAAAVVVTVYTPNSQSQLARLSERIQWEQVLRAYMLRLKEEFALPVVLCGDLNCAVEDIDIHKPKAHRGMPGFSDEERAEMRMMLAGFTDSYRLLHPETVGYTYFSNFAKSRERGVGWRLDYMLVSDADFIKRAEILGEYFGSDHVPILVDI
uniref:Endonuclease/exonuclease/phosphatase domain-containing protein n=1 Tax=viral metagenome TaxID=1070528 RepID=A0A6C0HJJ9_9ZZZZ